MPKTEEPVVAEEYVEDDDWDGAPDEGKRVKRTRTTSPLITATRAFEKAHKTANRARAALARVQKLVDNVEEAEKEEAAAYEQLQAELGKIGG